MELFRSFVMVITAPVRCDRRVSGVRTPDTRPHGGHVIITADIPLSSVPSVPQATALRLRLAQEGVQRLVLSCGKAADPRGACAGQALGPRGSGRALGVLWACADERAGVWVRW